jgi:hypothetical protein
VSRTAPRTTTSGHSGTNGMISGKNSSQVLIAAAPR